MKPRFVLSPEALEDMASIWHYVQAQSSREMADRVESVIRDRMAFLARNPGAGTGARTLLNWWFGSSRYIPI